MDALAAVADSAVWRHHTAREATEVVSIEEAAAGPRLRGSVTGVEGEVAFAVAYVVELDASWRTRRAEVRSLLADATTVLERSPEGEWFVDARPRPDLAGVVDVDLEASAVTNLLPVRREPLAVATAVPAAYVRLDLGVEELAQVYGPARRERGRIRVPYGAPRFGVEVELELDDAGMVVTYPGLATRLR